MLTQRCNGVCYPLPRGSTMKFLSILGFLGLIFTSFSLQAHAAPKVWVFDWGAQHWQDQDFTQPYLEDGVTPHNSQWEYDHWRPEDWIESRGSAQNVMNGLIKGGIITKQYEKNDIPALEVGQAFLQLSGQDKRRVMAFVDHMYGITRSPEKGMFALYLQGSRQQIGLFTRYGLQLQ